MYISPEKKCKEENKNKVLNSDLVTTQCQARKKGKFYYPK